jgi:tetratricopeptide (TPR) repeat protein
VNHDGIIDFAHDHARRAVEKRYVTSQVLRRAAHMSLGKYFLQTYNDTRPVELGELLQAGQVGEAVRTLQRQRLLDELPWQTAQAGEWDLLAELLGGDVLFSFAWLRDRFEVCRYWRDIERHRPGAVLRTYADLLVSPERDWDLAWHVALLLSNLGYKEQHAEIFGRLQAAGIDDSMSADERVGIQLLAALAQLEAGQRADGTANLDMAIAEADHSGAEQMLAAGLRNKAALAFEAAQHREALRLAEQAEAIFRRLDDRVGVASSLSVKAPILDLLGHPDIAAAHFDEQERIYRESGDLDELARALADHANMLSRNDNQPEAEALLTEALTVVQRLNDDRRLPHIYEVRARARLGRDWAGCLSDLDECERLARETGERKTEAEALYLRGVVAAGLGQWGAAESLANRAATIRRELNDERGIAQCTELAGKAIEERVAAFRRTTASGGS